MDCSSSLLSVKSLDISNFSCIDCSLQTTHVLCEFGCYLCLSCSEVHSSMGHLVKKQTDLFTNQQVKTMQVGGNTTLSEFFKYYGLESSDFYNKYSSKAAYFYAEMIKNIANDLNFNQEFPNVLEGKEIIETGLKENPDNSDSIITSQPLLESQEEPGFFSGFCKCFLGAVKKVFKREKEQTGIRSCQGDKKESVKSYAGYSCSTIED